jgi:lysozyme family protein
MADFKIAYNKTSLKEGGYANLANDKGGETWPVLPVNKTLNGRVGSW